MYYEMISNLQAGNKNELLKLIECFKPLLKKYAFLLGYQDAYDDLQLSFIEFLQNMSLKSLYTKNDGAIVEYIRVTIANFYKAEIKKIIKHKNEIPISALSENQQFMINNQNSYCDNMFFIEYEFDKILNSEEIEIIYLIYVMEYSASDIAKIQHKTRQAINQKKIRAINKLRKSLQENLNV